MKYELVYTRRAVKDIQKLDVDNKERIEKTLLRYRQNPLVYAEKLTVLELVIAGLCLMWRITKLLF